MEGKGELAVLDAELIIGETEVAFEPFEEGLLKDAATPVERVAREPDQLGLVKSQLLGLFELFPKLVDVD